LVERDDQLLVLPADADVAAAAVAPVTRWHVRDEDADHVDVTPELTDGIGLVLDYDNVAYKDQYRVYDHFYHDFRTRPDGVWFHETFRYQYQKPDFGALFGLPSASPAVVDAADTVAVYLIDPPAPGSFQPKAPLEHFGFFVNAPSMQDQM